MMEMGLEWSGGGVWLCLILWMKCEWMIYMTGISRDLGGGRVWLAEGRAGVSRILMLWICMRCVYD